MKRVGLLITVLVAMIAVSGGAASTASAQYRCRLVRYIGLWEDWASTQCVVMYSYPTDGWSLYNTSGAVAHGAFLCALVDTGEPSLFTSNGCGSSEEHKGTGEWELFYKTCEEQGGEPAAPSRENGLIGGPFSTYASSKATALSQDDLVL
jgi:hypothetical protein